LILFGNLPIIKVVRKRVRNLPDKIRRLRAALVLSPDDTKSPYFTAFLGLAAHLAKRESRDIGDSQALFTIRVQIVYRSLL
jgi:hypothetical protein